MKQVDLLGPKQNIVGLFSDNNKEPVLVKNREGHFFLVLPLEGRNSEEIFFHLEKLPENGFVQKAKKQIRYDKIDEICGSMKGLLTSSEEFAKNKQYEIELEERKWKK